MVRILIVYGGIAGEDETHPIVFDNLLTLSHQHLFISVDGRLHLVMVPRQEEHQHLEDGEHLLTS